MEDRFSRTELLLGSAAMEKLAGSRVAVFGIGGVGGFVVEGLARAGVGALDLIDDDTVSISNLNRQIIALESTIGEYKVDAAARRVSDINPGCKVRTYKMFFLPETARFFDFSDYDYVVDAIDTVAGKLAIIEEAKAAGVPVISSMGTGNKLDPTAFKVSDIYSTSVCPLAKVIRKECRKRGIDSLKVVYSEEEALTPVPPERDADAEACAAGPGSPGPGKPDAACACVDIKAFTKRQTPGSVSFVPSVAGLIIAGEVVKDLIG